MWIATSIGTIANWRIVLLIIFFKYLCLWVLVDRSRFFVVISQLINSTWFFVVIWAYLKIFDHKQTGILLFSTNCNSLLANKPFETVISEIRNFFYNMSILSSFCEEWKRIQWCLGINAYFYRLFLSKAIQTNRFAQILNFFAFI